MENLAIHSFLRWKVIILQILATNSLIQSLFERLGEYTFLSPGVKGLISLPASLVTYPLWRMVVYQCFHGGTQCAVLVHSGQPLRGPEQHSRNHGIYDVKSQGGTFGCQKTNILNHKENQCLSASSMSDREKCLHWSYLTALQEISHLNRYCFNMRRAVTTRPWWMKRKNTMIQIQYDLYCMQLLVCLIEC